MRELDCDVAVIGAGTAGIGAHRAARAAGARALLIERGPGGTTCARVGCMPSKLLAAAGDAAHRARTAGLFGIAVPDVRVDGRAVLGRLRAERDRFVRHVHAELDELPAAERLSGTARFLDGQNLDIDGETRVRFAAAVVATGSSPAVPKPLRGLGDRLLTTDTVFEIADLPRSLAILGGGPVGIEIAQAMARLGVRVALFDDSSTLAGLTEPGLVRAACEIFAAEMDLHLDTQIESATVEGDGVRLTWTCGGRSESALFARVLSAAGRPPNLAALDLARAGLALDEHGMPDVDPRSFVCTGSRILVAGDANALRPVLHEAARQGRIAGANAAALAAGRPPEAPEPWLSLAMVFTHPQTAAVGAPYEAEPKDGRVSGGISLCDQGRARVEGVNQGGIRLWGAPDGRLLGGELLAPSAEHLAHLLALAIADGHSAQSLRARPVYHPTLEEGLDSALADLERHSSR